MLQSFWFSISCYVSWLKIPRVRTKYHSLRKNWFDSMNIHQSYPMKHPPLRFLDKPMSSHVHFSLVKSHLNHHASPCFMVKLQSSLICHLFFDSLNLQSPQFSMRKAPIFQPSWQVVATWPWPHRRGSRRRRLDPRSHETLHWPGLVNLQKTMENHNFYWVNHGKTMGKPWENGDLYGKYHPHHPHHPHHLNNWGDPQISGDYPLVN